MTHDPGMVCKLGDYPSMGHDGHLKYSPGLDWQPNQYSAGHLQTTAVIVIIVSIVVTIIIIIIVRIQIIIIFIVVALIL